LHFWVETDDFSVESRLIPPSMKQGLAVGLDGGKVDFQPANRTQ
jgi:hypothetical protein